MVQFVHKCKEKFFEFSNHLSKNYEIMKILLVSSLYPLPFLWTSPDLYLYELYEKFPLPRMLFFILFAGFTLRKCWLENLQLNI